jgi:hypothetical protein
VPVHLHAPVADDGGSWSCAFEINWPGGPKHMAAGGYDAVQALVLACQMIGALLYTSAPHRDGRLWWDKPGRGYGFPVSRGLSDLLEGDDL